jgi:hypothetical protein
MPVPCMADSTGGEQGRCVAEIKMRMQYTYKEEHMPIWDHELGGLPRAPDQGGAAFVLGIIGAGQVGRRILDNV